ncbi:hypothetical protein HPB51_001700 [Rhipicephalus microplus]|uniref:Uncharacterized protein n=1 Tax=Rhipicephalus microplus TaxID=6941 RepID=A0A9J6E5L8_RHIMP|nr:hypothetical protein HPB51_001700 [Rhipicephalus microplus]
MNVDNYEPVEMEVDSDDGTQTCTLEVAAGSEDEDEDALRAQLLQAVLQKRRRKSKPPESPQQQQQLQQVQPQSSQQSPHQQQQYAVHWNPLLLPNGATTLAMVQPPAEPKEINRTASPNGFPPKAATPPSPFVTPKGRPVPDAPFVETKVSEPVVINLGMDDTTSEEEDGESEAEQEPLPAVENSFSLGLDKLLKEARQQSQVWHI